MRGVPVLLAGAIGVGLLAPVAPGVAHGRERQGIVDALICPVIALVFPHDGDLMGLWDCPPYDDPGGDPSPIPSPTLTPVRGGSILCPVLAIVFPPEGDVPPLLDCPPYG